MKVFDPTGRNQDPTVRSATLAQLNHRLSREFGAEVAGHVIASIEADPAKLDQFDRPTADGCCRLRKTVRGTSKDQVTASVRDHGLDRVLEAAGEPTAADRIATTTGGRGRGESIRSLPQGCEGSFSGPGRGSGHVTKC